MDKHKKNIFVQGPISPAFISDAIAKHSSKKDIGAHSIFLGQVRKDSIDGHDVEAIDYTSHEEMALAVMHQLREEMFNKFALNCLHVYHSLGRVNAGEICLFVFTSASHRKDAIAACSELVERIKAEIPVWGKEIFKDETFVWKKENEMIAKHPE